MSDSDTFEHHGSRPNPHPIADVDRPHDQLTLRKGMLIGIHAEDVARNLTVAADCDGACSYDLDATVEIRTRADANAGATPAFETDTTEQSTIADFDTAAAVLDSREGQSASHKQNTSLLEMAAQP